MLAQHDHEQVYRVAVHLTRFQKEATVADIPPFISPPTVAREQARARTEAEKFQPQSLWRLAKEASEADWTVYVARRPDGWSLVLGDPHHCIHVEWVPCADDRFPGKIWRLAHRKFRTRCPFGDTVDIEELRPWMRSHPADCAHRREQEGVQRPPIGELDYLPKACLYRHPHPGRWVGPTANPVSIANDPTQGARRDGDDV